MLPTHLPHYPAPAKLNLDLRITGRRADGYHELESIFVLTSLSDSLAITPRRDSRITLHTPAPNVPPEQDLCTRAARALQQFSGCRFGADIWLEKHIPMGGGLGGGSSDAATVLRVLNHLWHLELDCPTLIRIGATLGADIPFFIFGESAFARGIGDRLQTVSIPPQSFVIVRPPLHIRATAPPPPTQAMKACNPSATTCSPSSCKTIPKPPPHTAHSPPSAMQGSPVPAHACFSLVPPQTKPTASVPNYPPICKAGRRNCCHTIPLPK